MKLFKSIKQSQSGFTLLEILLVVGLIAILAGIVILALNPGKNLEDTRNSQRRVDVNTILNATYQYAIDNNGSIPATIPLTTPNDICTTGGSCSGIVDLSVLTASQKYLVSMPTDPTAATANSTGYEIVKSANGRVTVSAPATEGTIPDISVTR